MKKLLLLCVISCALFSRDDPFSPAITPKEGLHFQKEPPKEIMRDVTIQLPSTARALKSITITYQNIDGTTNTKEVPINQSIDWHYPLEFSQKAIGAQYASENRFKIGDFEVIVNGKQIFIATEYKNVRNFVLPKPHRIVLDFDGMEKAYNQKLNLNKKYFKSINLSSHENFYRISLEIDGRYKYEMQSQRDGYLIELR